MEPEKLEALAYRILDTGAESGIVVTLIDLQAGAHKIANAENIVLVQLNAVATEQDYLLRFLKQIMVGVSDRLNLTQDALVIRQRSTTTGIETELLSREPVWDSDTSRAGADGLRLGQSSLP